MYVCVNVKKYIKLYKIWKKKIDQLINKRNLNTNYFNFQDSVNVHNLSRTTSSRISKIKTIF